MDLAPLVRRCYLRFSHYHWRVVLDNLKYCLPLGASTAQLLEWPLGGPSPLTPLSDAVCCFAEIDHLFALGCVRISFLASPAFGSLRVAAPSASIGGSFLVT